LNKKTFSSFNASLSISFSLGNQFINGCLDLFKGGFHNGLSLSNFSINGSFDLSKEVNNIVFHFSRFNLVFDFIESVFDLLDNFHNVTESHVFSRFKLINKITKMFANGWDKVFNGVFQGWFKNIMQQVIKNVVSCQVVFQFSQFSHDLFQKLDKETLTLLNASFSFSFDVLNGSLDFFKCSFDNWLGSFNFGIHNSLQFVEEIDNIILDFSRFNLSLELIENVFDVLSNLHDISNGQIFNIFTGDKFANEISQVLLDGGDQILNGLAKGRLQDIIEEVIKDVESRDLVSDLSKFLHDLLPKISKNTFSSFDTCSSTGFDFLNSSFNLFKEFFYNRSSS